jgi:hypothetical protein
MLVIAFGVVTPSWAQVIVTVVGVVVTGTATLVPQVVPVHVPQLGLGLPAESVAAVPSGFLAGACVVGVVTCIVIPGVPVPLETGPIVPEMVNEIPVYADASIAQMPV